jgi:hypothetical protein
MNDREKLIELLGLCERCNAEYCNQCEFGEDIDGCVLRQKEIIADTLLSNGVTFATDTNDGSKWISVEDEKPKEFVPVLGHMTDAGDFPAVRECYLVGNVFFFPSLRDRHPVDKWMPMPEGE